ncbi:hypothetical protein [Acinetobacter bereziniae]|uniref:hypothetical protein n=1 Tax=Acinetobacter bereziniae TaxID=106648 RepID=UPI00073E929A|nr:hypothetical protein [Acinetobacter bereziniae]RSZ25725.1 hypothetical protein NDM229_006705 [Acinetobacter bereziniae]
MDKCREAFETWFRTTKAYQMLEEQNYFKMDIFHFVDGRNEYRHTSVQIAFMTWLSRQAELDQLVQEYSLYRNTNFSYEATAKHFETVANEKDKKLKAVEQILNELKESMINFKEMDLYDKGVRVVTDCIIRDLEKALGDNNANS